MSGVRQALVLGAIPIIVGLIYLVTSVAFQFEQRDAAGVTMLIALGLAMGFGMFVILRGAKDF
jgi:Flp pilus assembly protein TadB